jgi:hypothetical protein
MVFVIIRPVRALAGMRKATRQTASFSRMPIWNGLFSLNWDNFEGHVGFPLNTATVQKKAWLICIPATNLSQ